jgi:hypothetical protein
MSKRKNQKNKEIPSQTGISDKVKWLLDEDKIIIDELYNSLLRYIPTEFRSELIKIHEQAMARRERELTELFKEES